MKPVIIIAIIGVVVVIAVGKEKAAKLFWIFPLLSYCTIIIGVSTNFFPSSVIDYFANYSSNDKIWIRIAEKF